ncbi:MAG: MinD/ParA family protein, partial [Lachnospiraceae bacterium]|nr:MinD/ParA family protein [Lachnospiraceae bacterium]
GKGGVGKSNTAVNLAIQFRRMGKRVIIFDADFGLANVEVMFGTVPAHSLKDVIYGNMQISQVITEGPMDIGFISGGSGIVGLNDLNHIQVEALIRSLSQLGMMTDVLIIDTGAGVGSNVMDFVLASPEVVLVTTPEPSSLTDAYSLVKTLYKNPMFVRGGTNIRLLANRVTGQEEADAIYEKLNSIVKKFLQGEMSYLGMIPQDSLIERAVRSQQIVSLAYPQSQSAKAYETVAKGLLEQREGEPRYRWGIAQFFQRFLRQIS